jgi:hypothetical protein
VAHFLVFDPLGDQLQLAVQCYNPLPPPASIVPAAEQVAAGEEQWHP